MSFWTDKLSGRQPSNAQPLAAVRAWWAGDAVVETEVLEPPQQTQPTVRVTGPPKRASDGSCPECGSGNYMAATPSVAPRCFDCGYPLVQSTSGMVVSKNTPFGKPVRQVLGDGFHPNEIIGHGL